MIPMLCTIVHDNCERCHLDSFLDFVQPDLLSVVETYDILMIVLFGELFSSKIARVNM